MLHSVFGIPLAVPFIGFPFLSSFNLVQLNKYLLSTYWVKDLALSAMVKAGMNKESEKMD